MDIPLPCFLSCLLLLFASRGELERRPLSNVARLTTQGESEEDDGDGDGERVSNESRHPRSRARRPRTKRTGSDDGVVRPLKLKQPSREGFTRISKQSQRLTKGVISIAIQTAIKQRSIAQSAPNPNENHRKEL